MRFREVAGRLFSCLAQSSIRIILDRDSFRALLRKRTTKLTFMLVTISDLHLSDGTTSVNPNPEAFEILCDEIEDNARSNKAQDLHLLLLGDIFDLVRTDWWFDPVNVKQENRPWNGAIDPQTGMNANRVEVERQFTHILKRILRKPATRTFIEMINELASAKETPRLTLTYVVGNHDRPFNLFPNLQQILRERWPGLELQFANAFCDPAYGVCTRHGHEWDENCNARLLMRHLLRRDRNWDSLDHEIHQVMALGEVIAAELMSGLVHRVKESGDPTLAELIKGVDNLRPATDIFQWLQWRARGRHLSTREQDHLTQHLIAAIDGVVQSDYGKLWDKIQPDLIVSADLVDRLQLIRNHLRADGLDGLRRWTDLAAA